MKFNFTYLLLLFGTFISWSQTQISGSQSFSYCYGNYEESQTIYQSANGNALSIQFNSGEIEEGYDSITIIDGNGSGTELLSNYSGTLQGLNFTALSGYITINIVSDISLSCQDDIFD